MSCILALSLVVMTIFTILSILDFQKMALAIPYMGICGFGLLVSSAFIVIFKNQKFIIEQQFQQRAKVKGNDSADLAR